MHKIGIVSVFKSISTVLQRKKFFIYSKPQLKQNYIPFTMESPLSHLELPSSTGKVSSNFNNGVHLSYLEPRSSTGEVSDHSGGNGFAKGSSLYMVTDDLVIAPGSSTSTISFLTNLKIPPSDLEERVMSIGKKEGLSLLKASLISSSALTNGLGPFLQS